jgi:hypothetical protein
MMLRTASAIAISLAAILVSATTAPGNTFTIKQVAGFGNLSGQVSTLAKDIGASMRVLHGTDDWNCLEELHNSLDSMNDHLSFAFDLVVKWTRPARPLVPGC